MPKGECQNSGRRGFPHDRGLAVSPRWGRRRDPTSSRCHVFLTSRGETHTTLWSQTELREVTSSLCTGLVSLCSAWRTRQGPSGKAVNSHGAALVKHRLVSGVLGCNPTWGFPTYYCFRMVQSCWARTNHLYTSASADG